MSYGSRMGTWKPSVLRCCLLAPYVPLRFPCSESVPNREPYDTLSWRPSCDYPDKPHATSLIPPHITIAKKVTIPFPHYKDSTSFKVNPKNCTKKQDAFIHPAQPFSSKISPKSLSSHLLNRKPHNMPIKILFPRLRHTDHLCNHIPLQFQIILPQIRNPSLQAVHRQILP